MPTRESMYKLLVKDPDDVLGGLAYTAYKRHQEEVMTRIERDSGQSPTQADYESFFKMASSAASIEMYEQRAEALISAFLTETLEQRSFEVEANYAFTATAKTLVAIQEKQLEKRTWKGWIADSLGNLAVNFVTILLIAAAVTGYQAIDSLTGGFGRRVKVLPQELPAQPATGVTPESKLPAASEALHR